MLKNFEAASRWKVREYAIEFDMGDGRGFTFRCSSNGELANDLPKEAIDNYKWCMAHPENFVRWNRFVAYSRIVTNHAHGDCHCGTHIELYSEYDGACQCPKCGQWYNLFGQELIPPKFWEEERVSDGW